MYKDYEIKLNAILDKHGVQKVELGLVDDLKDADKLYKIALDMSMDINDEIESLSSMMNAAKASAKRSEEEYKILSKIEKGAKDLGIDTNTIKGYQRAVNNLAYVKKIQKIIDKSISKIKSAKL